MKSFKTLAVFIGLFLTVTACQDAKVNVKSKAPKFAGNTASGQNPLNVHSSGATVQTTAAGYTAVFKVTDMPINHSTASGYQFQGKVIYQ